MKPNLTFIWVFAVVLLVVTDGYGQTKIADTPPPAEVVIDIVNQPGCPLLLAVISVDAALPFGLADESQSRRTIRVKVANIDDKPIRGYALGFLDEKTKMISSTVMGRFIDRGQSIPIPASATGEWSKVLISVDYVEFSDGTSWGNDSFRRSQMIERFRAGRDLAMSRLNEVLVNYPAPEFFQKQVNVFLGVSTSHPSLEPSSEMLQKQFEFGFDSVVRGITAPGKRLAEGQEIAKRLESLRR